jgi:RND family efflux transporter MFP subunit
MLSNIKVGKEVLPSTGETVHSKSGKFVLYLLVATVGLISVGALPRLIQKQALERHTRAQLVQTRSVSVIVAQPGPAVEEFTLPGTTQAVQDAPMYARVDGYLHGVNVEIGDKVHKGQVLADIETPELDQQVEAAGSAVDQAKANLDNAREALAKAISDAHTAAANVHKAETDLKYYTAELDRYKQLAVQGAVSLEDRDSRLQSYDGGVSNLQALVAAEKSAQASINSARAAVRVAQAALSASQSQHDQYAATRSFRKVTALFDGIVTKRNVDGGALVTSGSTSSNTLLFEIAKTDVLRVYVYVPEQYVPYMHDGEKALLSFQEYPGRNFQGEVTNVSGGVDPVSKTLQVLVTIPNPDNKLLPGMYTQVRFEVPSEVRLATVPATTLQTRADGAFIYTVDNQNHVHMHKVEIGRDLGGQFEIQRGVQPGDKVVVNPPDEIQEGSSVNPVLAADLSKGNGAK